MNKTDYNIANLAERTGMSVKLVKHYLEKYQIEPPDRDLLNFNSFGEKHIKILSIVKEINKSRYFSQPLASYYIEQIKNSNFSESLPGEGEIVLSRVAGLIREVKELSST